MSKSGILSVHLCGYHRQHLYSELPVLEHKFFFRMSHFPLSPARLTGLSASLVSAALSCLYSCVLHAAYFLRSYDNKLNQRFAQSTTTHSSFSLPAEPLLSLTLHSNATQSPICHILLSLWNVLHYRDILSHFVKLVSGQLCWALWGSPTMNATIQKEKRSGLCLYLFLTAPRRLCSTVPASLAAWSNSSVGRSLRTARPPWSCSWQRFR